MTSTFDPTRISYASSMDEVRASHPRAMSRASDKVLDRLDRHCRAILARSTFCVIGTQGGGTQGGDTQGQDTRGGQAGNGADVSPRGDPAGFVRVLDDRHILLPDRIGNNRFDSYANIFDNPRIGMLFLVPGMSETLRINGRARVTNDTALLADSAVQGRAPKFGLLVAVDEAYLHCAKSINRARLWDQSAFIDRDELPSYGDMLTDQVQGLTAEESERQGAEMARRGLY